MRQRTSWLTAAAVGAVAVVALAGTPSEAASGGHVSHPQAVHHATGFFAHPTLSTAFGTTTVAAARDHQPLSVEAHATSSVVHIITMCGGVHD